MSLKMYYNRLLIEEQNCPATSIIFIEKRFYKQRILRINTESAVEFHT